VGKHRYWDGTSWTNKTVRPNPVSRTGRSTAEMVIGISGVVLGISPFITWTTVILLGNLDLFQLLEAGGHPRTLAWLIVLCGAGAAVWGWFGDRHAAVGAIVIGLIAGILSVILLIHLRREVRQIHEVASVGIGAWLAPIACVGLIVGGFMATRTADQVPS
jgi:MFS family permease